MEYIFLLKTNEDDRDCVKYLDLKSLGKFECGHYFGGVHITGACFAGFEKELKEMSYNNFETVLTEEELKRLWKFDDKIHELGYNITEGDERYLKGIKLREEIQDIVDKLLGKENQELFEKIQEDEKEYLKNEYGLDDEDIEQIFDNYYLDYRDRAIVSCVWNNIDDCAYDEAYNMGYVDGNNDRYFNFENFGEDLLNSENYLELRDGRVVMLNY